MSSLSSPAALLSHRSTLDFEPSERFEAWRGIAHNWVDLLPLPRGELLDADLTLLRSDAAIFGVTRSSAYEMRTGPRHVAIAEDMVVVSLLAAGEMLLNGAPGENRRVAAGMLGLYAPRQEGHYRWSRNARQVYVALPRDAAMTALGREPTNLPLAPERCALAPLLVSQLEHLAQLTRPTGSCDALEHAALLEGTRALALLMLRNLGRQGENADLPDLEESLNAGRRAAALRFMEREAHRHDLDAAAIAHGAGCSRTRLYAAFAAYGETVMGALREIRLQRARGLIEQLPRLHVGTLSWRCGFADSSGFGKLFRARFGLPPSEWHRRAGKNPGIRSTF